MMFNISSEIVQSMFTALKKDDACLESQITRVKVLNNEFSKYFVRYCTLKIHCTKNSLLLSLFQSNYFSESNIEL